MFSKHIIIVFWKPGETTRINSQYILFSSLSCIVDGSWNSHLHGYNKTLGLPEEVKNTIIHICYYGIFNFFR